MKSARLILILALALAPVVACGPPRRPPVVTPPGPTAPNVQAALSVIQQAGQRMLEASQDEQKAFAERAIPAALHQQIDESFKKISTNTLEAIDRARAETFTSQVELRERVINHILVHMLPLNELLAAQTGDVRTRLQSVTDKVSAATSAIDALGR